MLNTQRERKKERKRIEKKRKREKEREEEKKRKREKEREKEFLRQNVFWRFRRSGARWANWRERGERHRDSETVLRTVDTHRRGVRAGAGVVGTTAGSQRSGTRSTSGIAQCAARAIATTELVAEAAKNTLGSSCKNKKQRTAASAAAAKAWERCWTKKPSEVHSTRR